MSEARATLEAALADAEALAGRLRAALAEMDGEPDADDTDGSDMAFADYDLIETSAAAARFGIADNTIRKWLRADPTLGRKVKGRWFVSIRRMREIRNAG